MSLDNLKITVLRAAKPGDVVFFNVGNEPSPEARGFITALVDYLRPTGINAVMLPDSIQVVGSLVPCPFTEGERQSFLKAVEYALASGFNLGYGDITDLRGMYDRMWPKAPFDVRMEALIKQIQALSRQTAGSPDPEKTQSTGARDTDPSAC